MKAVALGVLVALAAVQLASSASCSVDRHSTEFACTSDGECQDGRACDHGFCVEQAMPCPSPCDACSFSSMTCEITCNSGSPCGDVQCPPGFECTIRCNNPDACTSIDCAQGTGCDITCNNAMACGPINCGSGECTVDCAGSQACQSIDCAGSCACDVKCNNPNACPPPSCPLGPTQCTRNNEPGAPCDSSQDGACDQCP